MPSDLAANNTPIFSDAERHGAFSLGVELLADQSSTFAASIEQIEQWRWHLVYAAIEIRRNELLKRPKSLGDVLASAPLKQVAAHIYGVALPGLKRALGRLAPVPMRAGGYRLLGRSLACPVRRKLVFHAPQVSSSLLAGIDALPDAAVSAKVLGWDHGDAELLRCIRQAVDAVRRMLDPSRAMDAWRSLASLENSRGLKDWLGDYLSDLALPAPPWEGTETIRPIRTLGELRQTSKAFQNCLWDRHQDFLAGYGSVYRCMAPGVEAVAEVSSGGILGPRIVDIKGIANRTPPPEVLDFLVASFASAGIVYEGEARRHYLY